MERRWEIKWTLDLSRGGKVVWVSGSRAHGSGTLRNLGR